MEACSKCGKELEIGDWPFCKGDPFDHTPGRYGVIPDEIPGGIEIRHGICNEDGSPRRYYSHSEMREEAKRRGVVNRVEHVTNPKLGTDKNPHTTRWI